MGLRQAFVSVATSSRFLAVGSKRLATRAEPPLVNEAWAHEIGASSMVGTRAWGAVTERRLSLSSGMEIDVAVAPGSWASVTPVDAGTAWVVADGFATIYDPDGLLAALGAAIAFSFAVDFQVLPA